MSAGVDDDDNVLRDFGIPRESHEAVGAEEVSLNDYYNSSSFLGGGHNNSVNQSQKILLKSSKEHYGLSDQKDMSQF